ncbi:MAG TPA: hypothetical protein VHO07_27165, partial [Streptosporangiaceae bacterium]|nr:hypothetical protein [Streptosporangiaceae bacterium]
AGGGRRDAGQDGRPPDRGVTSGLEARGKVRRILVLTGLIDVFSVHASVEDAVRIARPVVTAG